jgi:uncharacterized protein (TIGR03067 family)
MAAISTILLAGGFCFGSAVVPLPNNTKLEAQDGKDDIKKLQGEWVVVSVEAQGKQLQATVGQKLTIKDNEWTPPGAPNAKFMLKLDPSKTPKEIDLTSGTDTFRGIYKLDGDTFTFCSTYANGQRPKEFKADPAVFFMVLKRDRRAFAIPCGWAARRSLAMA